MEQLANHVRSLAILSLSSTLTGRPRLSMTTWTQKRVLKMFPTHRAEYESLREGAMGRLWVGSLLNHVSRLD